VGVLDWSVADWEVGVATRAGLGEEGAGTGWQADKNRLARMKNPDITRNP
jgi:hypothetical protein